MAGNPNLPDSLASDLLRRPFILMSTEVSWGNIPKAPPLNDIMLLAEVSEMTRLPQATLRFYRHRGTAVAQDFREVLRLEEIAKQLDAEVTELQREFTRKQEDLILARQQIGEARERIRAAGVVEVDGRWQFPEDADGEH